MKVRVSKKDKDYYRTAGKGCWAKSGCKRSTWGISCSQKSHRRISWGWWYHVLKT